MRNDEQQLVTYRLKWTLLAALVFMLLSPLAAHSAETPAGNRKAGTKKRAKKTPEQRAKEAKNRANSVRAVLKKLGIGEGAVIGDIGAGSGQDSWTFADIVGKDGKVFAEEISEDKTKKLKEAVDKKGLNHIQVITGTPDDPRLPEATLDVEYMHIVYHHFTKPAEMLQKLWKALKPGGFLVIVDQRKGTLQDWVPREERGKKHFWIAETTVVRDAREQGFSVVGCLDEHWIAKEPFVLVFQRPAKGDRPNGDPDSFCPLSNPVDAVPFLTDGIQYANPVFVAIGEARDLIKPILQKSTGEGMEIVLEEWATTKDERQPLPNGISMPSVLTEKGDPKLGSKPIDAVFFLDSYHLLFHGKTLLKKLNEKLTPAGRVFVLDREATKSLSRREASHHRQIAPQTVKNEMAAAGFRCVAQGPRLAKDRFLLIFDKKPASQTAE
jgi:predicted methyltransferase